MNLKSIIRKLHLWLGLLTGAVIFIVAFTGCLQVFRYDIQEKIYRNRYKIKNNYFFKQLPISKLQQKACEVIPKEIPCLHIYIPNKSDQAVQFIFQSVNDEAWTYSDYLAFSKTVHINPYTGKILHLEDTKWEFFNVIFWIHTSLLLGYKVGNTIITYSIYIFIFMLLSGLYLWWPSKRDKSHYFWFQWNNLTRWKRKNFDLHRILGFYNSFLALIFALTGLFWASETFQSTAKRFVNNFQHSEPIYPPVLTNKKATDEPAIDKVQSKILSIFPTTDYVLIKMPKNANAPIIVRANNEEQEYRRREYIFDQKSGELIYQETFHDKNYGDKLAALNYDIHVGTIGGLTTKILAFLASLISASLPITGFYIWWGKKRRNQSSSQNRLAKSVNSNKLINEK